MADFYSTVPAAGENPVEYWLRLNKAVDTAEEGLKRLGRRIEDPCQEVAMMFVKHCPNPSLAAVFKFKAPGKWTASEIQEYIDRYQIEMKEQLSSKSKRLQPVMVHAQSPTPSPETSQSNKPSVQCEDSAAPSPPCNDDSLKVLVSLFNQALSQNRSERYNPKTSDQFQHKCCKVCQSLDHSTLAHCRQHRLCLGCFKPNHIKRDCPNRHPGQLSTSPQHKTLSL